MDAPKSKVMENKWKWDNLGPIRNQTLNKQGHIEETRWSTNRSDHPPCNTCGKNHGGECLMGKSRCYWCKEEGHTIANFTKKPNGGGSNPITGGQARMFAMTREEAGR